MTKETELKEENDKKLKMEIYCKNPLCFNSYLARHKIKEKSIDKDNFNLAIQKALEIIEEIQNPYPKDIFLWDNKDRCDFSRGRFNQFCFELWEGWIKELTQKLNQEKEK